MAKLVFRTEQEAEEYALSLRDSGRDPETGFLWARDPVSRAFGKVYITPCVAFTRKGERVGAYTINFGA